MFSNLGPLFKATFRQTEQADTRMSIRKDDPRDQQRKREAESEETGDSDLWEDSMGVSIEALRVFLENFGAGKIPPAAGGAPASNAEASAETRTAPVPEIRPPQNTQTARAVHAYQSMAEKTGGGYHAPPAEAQGSDLDLLHAQDVRVIYDLIKDLKDLAVAGYDTLPLERSDSFLQALQDAVTRLKSGV